MCRLVRLKCSSISKALKVTSRVQPLKVTKEGSTPSKAQPLKALWVFKATTSRSREVVRTRGSLIQVGIPRRLRIRMLS